MFRIHLVLVYFMKKPIKYTNNPNDRKMIENLVFCLTKNKY